MSAMGHVAKLCLDNERVIVLTHATTAGCESDLQVAMHFARTLVDSAQLAALW
jgi:hypothetical protein